MRRMPTTKEIDWTKAVKEYLIAESNGLTLGGITSIEDLYLQGEVIDENGDSVLEIGTSDISISKNVNIGNIDDTNDLYVSGKITIEDASNLVDKYDNPIISGGGALYQHELSFGIYKIYFLSSSGTPITSLDETLLTRLVNERASFITPDEFSGVVIDFSSRNIHAWGIDINALEEYASVYVDISSFDGDTITAV